MARITLENITHTYDPRSARVALERLDHVWEPGRAYALLGPSGCGKTTLLNIISGLVIPSEGRVLFDGKDVTQLPTERRNIAQVFQFPVIYDTMSVGENLAFPLKNRGMDRSAIRTRVAEVADLLGLTKDLSRRARNLTAEAKQRVSLGRGLVRADVAAILFDEPLTVIDPSLKWQLRSKLKAVHRALDLLMIYVTHDQVEALTFADEVVVMKDGRVLQVATPARLFEQPEHTFVGYFIGSPGMNLVAADVDGHVARVAGQAIELGAHYPKLAANSTAIGFRPDYAFLVANGDGGVPVKIRRMEDVGRRRLARVALGPHEIFATVPHDVRIDGEQAHLAIRQDRLFVYAYDELVPGDRR
jgi:glycerol transport system ATP-binding protein